MIQIKTEKEIKIMEEGGRRLVWVMDQILKAVKPGVILEQLDNSAEELIKRQGGKPSFKMVPGYKWATCINVNQGVVHGIPGNYRLKNGDIVSLDIGFFYRGFHTDTAKTVQVGNFPPEQAAAIKIRRFLAAGERALKKAIQVAKAGNRVGHISEAIEKEIKKVGFSPIETLTGHGIGKKLHEEPQIPCFLREQIKDTPELKPGMTLAVEVIYAQGSPKIVLKDDNWTAETADGSPAALFEKTILITPQIAKVLT